jgi:hypothetical protein
MAAKVSIPFLEVPEGFFMRNKGICKYKMQKQGDLYSCGVAFLVWSDWGGVVGGVVLALKLKSATMKDKKYM